MEQTELQTRFNVTLSADAAAVLMDSTSERKRGEYLSEIILRCAYGSDGDDLGVMERMDRRLARIEQMLTVVVAELAAQREGGRG